MKMKYNIGSNFFTIHSFRFIQYQHSVNTVIRIVQSSYFGESCTVVVN